MNINPKQLEQLDQAFAHFFPKLENPNLIYSSDSPWSTPDFSWDNRKAFVDFIEKLTGIKIDEKNLKSVKYANEKLHKVVETTPPEEVKAPEQPAETTPQNLEQLQEEEDKRQQKLKQTQVQQKKAVEEGIARKQQIAEEQRILKEKIEAAKVAQAELDGKKIYAKVEVPTEPDLTAKEQQDLQLLRDLAKKDPQKLVKDFSTKLEKVVGDKTIAQVYAADIVEKLNPPAGQASTYTQGVILNNLAKRPEAVQKTLKTSEKAAESLKNGSIAIALHEQSLQQKQVSQILLGEKFAEVLYGPDVNNAQVEFSSTPQQGYQEVDLGALHQNATVLQQNQSVLLDSVQDLGVGQARNLLLDQTSTFIESKIASLPADSTIKALYSSPEVISILSNYGITTGTTVAWEGAGLAGKFVSIFPETGPLFSIAGKIIGKEFVTPIITEGVKQVGKEVVKKGAEVAVTEAATTAAGTATGEGLSITIGQLVIPIPGLGAIIGAIVGFIASKIIEPLVSKLKELWTKNKDKLGALLAVPAGIFALRYGGAAAAAITALAFLGPKRVLAAGVGAWAIAKYMLKGTMTAIFTPILVVLLVLPPLVAFIMFVINSGAYLVPPSDYSQDGRFSSPYVDITKTPNPPGPFSNSDFPKEITYIITIKPKKGPLTNVNLDYDCKVISKSSVTCPDIKLESGYEDVFNSPIDSISPTGLTFSYTSTYDNQFKDSAIIDSIILSANTSEEPNVNSEVSASVTFGTPPISCPVPGAKVATPSLNYSLNQPANTGHGSQAYWQAMGQSPSAYALPQGTGCHSINECSYYGYAYDVFPTGTKEVFAPTVEGKDVTWTCSYAFPNKNSGHTYKCNGSGYTLVLTHMANNAKTGVINSGEKIGTLFDQGSNTHLHMEFSINGRWQKPENYFCQ